MEQAAPDPDIERAGIGFERPHETGRNGRPPGHAGALRTDRRRKVARMLAVQAGMTCQQVADAMGISQSTASRDMAAVKAEWRKEMVVDMDVVIARDLAELGMVKQEAWRTWAMSLEVGERVVTVAETKDGTFETVTETNPKANLHALRMVQTCIEKRRRILGLDQEKGGGGAKHVSFTVRIGDRVLVSEASTVEPDDVVDAEMVELDSTGKALPSGD